MKFVKIETTIFYYRQLDNSISKKKKLLDERSKIISKVSKKLSGNYKQKIVAVIPVKNFFPGINNVALKKR